jgi:ankyrin repeat protein
MEKLRKSIDADPSAGTKVDSLGMTPFHILALSQRPLISLFQELLKVYKVDIIHTRDKFGSTPLDYLCSNCDAGEHRMLIRSLLQRTVVQHIQWLGLARWKEDISTFLDWALRFYSSRHFGMLHFKLATYERLEAISLLELALWKVKIDECKVASESDNEYDKESSPKRPRLDRSQLDGVDRQSCRIYCRAHVVISNVLPFLDKVSRKDYTYCVGDVGTT